MKLFLISLVCTTCVIVSAQNFDRSRENYYRLTCPTAGTDGSLEAIAYPFLDKIIVVCDKGLQTFVSLKQTLPLSFEDATNCKMMVDKNAKSRYISITLQQAIPPNDGPFNLACPITAPTVVLTAPVPRTSTVAPTASVPLTPTVALTAPVPPTPAMPPKPPAMPPAIKSGPKLDAPIVHLSSRCPTKSSGSPTLKLTADVPAYAKANCQNGAAAFTTLNEVEYLLPGTFDNSNGTGKCLFHKKNGSNTFTVDVEVGWGEKGSQVMSYNQVKTISCAYDDYGNALSSKETIADWFLAPLEMQSLMGSKSSVTFDLKVVDVLNAEIDSEEIPIGRTIRLMATNASGTVSGFRALSCVAKNKVDSFDILRAGCGDGLVFLKSEGFHTKGNVVFSPYFDAFKLSGGVDLKFECTFTVCRSRCDGVMKNLFDGRRRKEPKDVAGRRQRSCTG